MTDPAPVTLRRRRLLGLGALLLLAGVGFLASLVLGAREVPFRTVMEALPAILDPGAAAPAPGDLDHRVIVELRFPRTLLALVVGAALGTAGALIQGHMRNPLADPGILGVSAGAALAVVIGFAFFGIVAILPTAIVAFAGAIAATAAVFAVGAVGRGPVSPLSLVLGGAALTAVLGSVTSALVLTDEMNLDRMRFWTAGSVAGRDLGVFWGVLPFVVLGLLVAFATGPTLNVLNLGDDTARALGVNTTLHRTVGVIVVAALAGVATAAAGPIGFIGLVVPHIARSLCGPDYRWLLPYSALCGAVLLLFADIVGRVIARPGELQVGIVLAFVGAPFFIYLVHRRKVVMV